MSRLNESRIKGSHFLLNKVLLCFLVGVLIPYFRSSASVVADFAGGGSTASPITSTIDAFPGKVGSGWLTAWITDNNGVTLTGVVTSGNLGLNGGGNYLSVSGTWASNTSGSYGSGYVVRQFDNTVISVTSPITYKWTFSTSAISQFNFFSGTSNMSSTGPSETWLIQISSGKWQYLVGDGSGGAASTQVTTMSAVADHIYTVTVYSDPTSKSYSFTINDLTASTSYSSPTGILWRSVSQGNSEGTYLMFGGTLSSGTMSFNLANLSITSIPEPKTKVFLGLAVFFLGITFFFRNRKLAKEIA